MGIFNKINYVEIGKMASAEDLSKIFGNVSRGKQGKLINGAIEAFRNGNPENLRAILSASATTVNSGRSIVLQIIKSSSDEAAVINSAFKNASEDFKKRVLDAVLFDVIRYSKPAAEESLVAALLKCGANANAEQGGFTGSLLAFAVFYDQPPSVIQLLIDNGASVEGALQRAYAKSYDASYIRELMIYKAEPEKKPRREMAETDTQATILELRKDVQVLTEKVSELSIELRAALVTIRSKPKLQW